LQLTGQFSASYFDRTAALLLQQMNIFLPDTPRYTQNELLRFRDNDGERMVANREADHSPSSNPDVKNAWSYKSTPPYTFM
jgi:hypothetical protein